MSARVRLFVLLLAWVISLSASAQPSLGQAEKCDRLSRPQDLPATTDAKIQLLERRLAECRGTGLFESRLAAFYFEAGRLAEAEALLNEALKHKNEYHKELIFGLADIDYARGMNGAGMEKAQRLVREYPAWHGGYMLLSKGALVQGRFKEAIEYGKAANQRSPEPGVYLAMAIAHYQLDQNDESVAAAYEAIRLDPKSVAKRAGINEAIYALVALKRNDEARKLAKARAAADPKWREDAAFVKAIRYLESR